MQSRETKLDRAQIEKSMLLKRTVVQDTEIAQLKARLQDWQKAEEHARDARRAEDLEVVKTLKERLEVSQRHAVSDAQFLKARLQEQVRLKEAAECQNRKLLLAMGKNIDGSLKKVK